MIIHMENLTVLTNGQLSVAVSAHGAELCSLRKGEKEYLWQADPAYWKRHSPVLFPIVGSVWENRYRVDSEEFMLSQHGFARDLEFQLLSKTDREVWYELTDDAQTRCKFPFAFCLKIGYRLEGGSVEVIWKVTNPADRNQGSTLPFQIGAHPAFYFPDYEAEPSRRGFFSFDSATNLNYILISAKGCVDAETHYPLQLDAEGMLPLDVHTFDRDALILEDRQVKEVTLHDVNRNPVLRLRFPSAPLVGLWSPPGKNAPFVCIEPWYGRCDRAGFEGDFTEKDWVMLLKPDETFEGGYWIDLLDEAPSACSGKEAGRC